MVEIAAAHVEGTLVPQGKTWRCVETAETGMMVHAAQIEKGIGGTEAHISRLPHLHAPSDLLTLSKVTDTSTARARVQGGDVHPH